MNYAPKNHYREVSARPDAGQIIGSRNDDPIAIRSKILQLQESMKELPSTLQDCTLRHIFAPGLYAREMTIPEGTVIVGKIHKHAHVNTISKGRCSVMTEFGPMEIQAPHTFVSEPGTKRVVVALEEVIWTTYHPSNETDLDKLEEGIIAKSYEEIGILDAPLGMLKIEEGMP